MFKKFALSIVLVFIMAFCIYYFNSEKSAVKKVVPGNAETNYSVCYLSDIHTGSLILVNNSVPYDFSEKPDIVSVYSEKNRSYKVSDKTVSLNISAIRSLDEMMNDFEKNEKLNDIIIVSGYRTMGDQERIMKEKIKQLGKTEAEKWAAHPGYSEHHTGLSMDIGIYRDNGQSQSYTGLGKYAWINENCGNYGFILRYTGEKAETTGISGEPWHYRFVGKPHANIIRSRDFCLEEYIDYLKSNTSSSKPLYYTDYDGIKYEIYYVRATNGKARISAPKNKDYSVSGNNVDGFIVTVKT